MRIASTEGLEPVLSWDLVRDVQQLFDFPFMVNAYRAGTIVAVVAGLVGWFMVLRRQSFAGHTLAVVGFPGAAGAVLVGVSTTLGFLTFCLAAALVIALASPRTGSDDAGADRFAQESAVTGTVQALALGSGFLFASLHGGFLGGVTALLFGDFLGITTDQVRLLGVGGAVVVAVLAGIGRPLLFASVDPAVAASRGVPVRLLSLVFLGLLGVAAAQAAQITGALLVFALLVVPAATAQVLVASPAAGLVVTVGCGLAAVWSALFLAYYAPYPIGFLLTSITFAGYLAARLWRRLHPHVGPVPAAGAGAGAAGLPPEVREFT